MKRTNKVVGKVAGKGAGTLLVHGEGDFCAVASPSSMPIYQASTFFFTDPADVAAIAGGQKNGFVYTRMGNPTVKAFEDKIALLEESDAAVAFSSGMAAVAAVLLELLEPGDEVISSSSIYGGTRIFFDRTLRKLNCPVLYFDPQDDLKVKLPSLITKKTRLIFFESPSNPSLSIIDVRVIADIARKYRLVSVIDNTFATPYLQKPLLEGIDCVIHSATKYIGGHGDALGGIVAGPEKLVRRLRENMLMNLGGCLSPFNAWLFLRGLKTLHLRMDCHCRSAAAIAEFLAGQNKVRSVLYPGLREHPGHRTAGKQMKDYGGVVSLTLGSRAACRRFMKRLRLCRVGVSLGDTETIVMNAALMFNSKLSDAACLQKGIDPTLIRISTGLEDAADIIGDIGQALKGL
ncbi:MAG: methionine gamma-lyase [Thermodesulfovibrio sp.]|nr:methionine gamma-lyase [Thermodesulfovibrio sp.]